MAGLLTIRTSAAAQSKTHLSVSSIAYFFQCLNIQSYIIYICQMQLNVELIVRHCQLAIMLGLHPYYIFHVRTSKLVLNLK